MNKSLTKEIVYHILSGFGLLWAEFIDLDKIKSIKSVDYLLSEKVSFEDDEGKTIVKKIWGIQLSIENQDLKILITDCSLEKDISEYAALIQLKDTPAYGMYLVTSSDLIDSEALIAVSVDNKNWMQCSTYLQATFLAGMENAKEIGFSWNKCQDYKQQYDLLLSFIKYHNKIYEALNEGEKD